jgi:TatD DNase family protein
MSKFPNLFIGLTPLVTFRSATMTHQVARQLPLDKLLLETDAPYFLPSCFEVSCCNAALQ